MDQFQYRETRDLPLDPVLALYRANCWSSAQKPEQLYQALLHSHSLITAWDADQLVGLGNAISDGFLVVYYPHLLVLPSHQGQGIGRGIMERLTGRYKGFHQQILVADHKATRFYQKLGFEQAGKTEAMWIYSGSDHK